MKKIFRKSNIFSFFLGAIIFGGIVGVSAYTILAKDISYSPKDTTWEVDNIKDAIDDLYTTLNSEQLKLCKFIDGTYGAKETVGAKYECKLGDGETRYFYILKNNPTTVDLLMDRNITDYDDTTAITYNSALNYFVDGVGSKYTEKWVNVVNIKVPDVNSIAEAAKIINLSNWICLGSKKQDLSSSPWCNAETNQSYAWLFNYLTGCKDAGCTNDEDAKSPGYWTSTAYNNNQNWYMNWRGAIMSYNTTDARGLRPVITVLKSQLY